MFSSGNDSSDSLASLSFYLLGSRILKLGACIPPTSPLVLLPLLPSHFDFYSSGSFPCCLASAPLFPPPEGCPGTGLSFPSLATSFLLLPSSFLFIFLLSPCFASPLFLPISVSLPFLPLFLVPTLSRRGEAGGVARIWSYGSPPPYLQGAPAKTPSRCLKPRTVRTLIDSVFLPSRAHLR